MPDHAANSRFRDSTHDPEAKALDAELDRRHQLQRSLENRIFEATTRDLDRPLLRPKNGRPLREAASEGEVRDHEPAPDLLPTDSLGGTMMLPPVHFTDDELQDW